MRDIGLITNDEPVKRLFTQGMVIKDGAKMSKNKGNVVSADEMIERFGADTGRVFELFAAPPEKDLDWTDAGAEGCQRFLGRVLPLRHAQRRSRDASATEPRRQPTGRCCASCTRRSAKSPTTSRRAGTSTPRSQRSWSWSTSSMRRKRADSGAGLPTICEKLDAAAGPFAPYMAEELWEEIGQQGPVFRQPWPAFDEELARKKAPKSSCR